MVIPELEVLPITPELVRLETAETGKLITLPARVPDHAHHNVQYTWQHFQKLCLFSVIYQ